MRDATAQSFARRVERSRHAANPRRLDSGRDKKKRARD
jgi:hypothetical protein